MDYRITDEMIRRTFYMDSPEAHERTSWPASEEGRPTLTVFDIAAWRAKRHVSKIPP